MKKAIILILLITFLTLAVFIYVDKSKSIIVLKPTDDLISERLLKFDLKESKITKEFLDWVNNEYIGSLNEIENQVVNGNYTLKSWHQATNNSLLVLLDLYNNKYENNDRVKIINTDNKESIISFIGDVSLADNFDIMPAYDSRNKKVFGILSESVVNTMKSADIMVANNEFAFSDRGSAMPNKIYTFRGNTKRVSIYEEMGVNLVTLANNHVYDFGEDAFLDTLDTLKNADIPYVGAGRNIKEAQDPFYYIINGYKVGFVNATRAEKFILTPEAKENSSGVQRAYNPTMFLENIAETKKQSDYVVALIHWGKEDTHVLEDVQIDTGKQYIDAGADILVGTHAHTLQGIEMYKNKPIIYNLGDFIFIDETKDTAILTLKLDKEGNFKYYFLPALQKNMYTSLHSDSEKLRVINNMRKWSINTTFTDDGEFFQTN